MSLLTELNSISEGIKKVFSESTEKELPDSFSSLELDNNELRKKNEELKDLIQDRKERKNYASKLYWLILLWLFIMLLFILFQGLGFIPFTSNNYKLSDTVLITLISTTTANVAAFFLVVVKYLFRVKR